MKITGIILCLLMLFGGMSEAQVTEIYIVNPGSGGMQSNYGIHTLSLDQLYYAYNIDVTTTPGEIRRRPGIINYGANSEALYGAFAYNNSEYGYNLIVGVKGDTADPYRGVFCYSDTFGTSLNHSIFISEIYPYKDSYHDWVLFDSKIIHADGKNLPFVFVGESNFKERLAIADKSRFSPKIMSFGAEAPGQPRVSVYNESTTQMRGVFTYAFSYGGSPGIQSAPIKIHNQAVLLSHFPFIKHGITGSDTSRYLFILRQSIIPEEFNRGDNISGGWYAIDSLHEDSVPQFYIDTLPRIEEGGQWGWDTTWYKGGETITSCDTCGNILFWGEYWCHKYILVNDTDRWILGSDFVVDSVTGDATIWEQCNEDSGFTSSEWQNYQTEGYYFKIGTTRYNIGFYPEYCPYPVDNIYPSHTYLPASLSFGFGAETTYTYSHTYTNTYGQHYRSFRADSTGTSNCYYDTGFWCYKNPCDTDFICYDSAIVGMGYHDKCDSIYSISEWLAKTYDYKRHDIDYRRMADAYSASPCIDSIVPKWDSVSYYYSSALWYDWTKSGGIIPGQAIDTNITDTDNVYCRVAYSYYDPITKLESPLSPPVQMRYDSSIMGISDTLYLPYNEAQGFSWIRIYQTVVNTVVVGAKDTTVWYGVMQVRYPSMLDTSAVGVQKIRSFPMRWADTTLANGLDSSDVSGNNDYPYHFFRTILGDVVLRPPYIYDNQVSFSDMEYVSNRLVGIGDPITPERLYYSERNSWFTNVFNWPYFNYLDINEGGTSPLIAIERAEGFGRDALYVFTHGTIYLVDIENGTVEMVESNIGAVSRQSVVKYGKTVYFLAPNMRVYALYGSNATDISDPVANWVDSLFTNETTASTNCRLFRLGQSIKFFDTASGVGLSFNTNRGLWSLESYGDDSSYIPLGSFGYDSSGTGKVANYNTSVLFSDDAVPLRVESDTTTYDFDDTAHATAFQTAFFGDGKNFWSLERMQLTVRSLRRVWLRYAVYDGENALLVSDSIYCGDLSMIGPPIVLANPGADQVIDIGYNIAKYLSVRIYTNPSASGGLGNDIKILDMRLFIRNMGRGSVN